MTIAKGVVTMENSDRAKMTTGSRTNVWGECPDSM